MASKERILILNYLNAAYRLAFHEKADKTQVYLFRVISFLRYYLNEIKIVRLKNELNYLRDFLLIHEESTGRTITRTLDFTEETAEVDLPAKTLILIVQELLVNEEERGDGIMEIDIHGFLDQEQFVVTFDCKLNGDDQQFLAKLTPLIEEIKYLFDVSEPIFFTRCKQKTQLCLRLPFVVGGNE